MKSIVSALSSRVEQRVTPVVGQLVAVLVHVRLVGSALVLALVVAGCSTVQPTRSPTTTPPVPTAMQTQGILERWFCFCNPQGTCSALTAALGGSVVSQSIYSTGMGAASKAAVAGAQDSMFGAVGGALACGILNDLSTCGCPAGTVKTS